MGRQKQILLESDIKLTGKAMQVAVFVRVSTKSQEYDRQISDLTAYADKMGIR